MQEPVLAVVSQLQVQVGILQAVEVDKVFRVEVVLAVQVEVVWVQMHLAVLDLTQVLLTPVEVAVQPAMRLMALLEIQEQVVLE
jgi:hypothetical protein